MRPDRAELDDLSDPSDSPPGPIHLDELRVLEFAPRALHFPPLPKPRTSLIGREQEIERVLGLVTDPQYRLVTLVGTGGIGKSRLALAVAHTIADAGALPVAFVSLASLRNPSRLIAAISARLALPDLPSDPTVQQFAAVLGGRRLVLVLDNLEQLLPAAPVLAELLDACPAMTLLCASRSRLRLSGEQVVPVDGLELPATDVDAPEEALASPAVRLFVERAMAMLPGFEWTTDQLQATAAICRRVEGEPLAIELAAARVRILPPTALLARMDPILPALGKGPVDADPRLQTMDRAIQWSYDLLLPRERDTLRQLAVFIGSCSLEELDAVLPGTRDDHLESIELLQEASLLRTMPDADGSVRISMTPPVWEYAHQLLIGSADERALRDAHADHFVQWLRPGDFYRNVSGRSELLRHYVNGWPNVRAAFEWLVESGQGERALELTWAASDLGWLRLHTQEVSDWMERAYDVTAGDQASPLRVRITSWIGLMASIHADDDKALRFSQEAIERARVLGDLDLLGFGLRHGGQIARNAGAIDRSIAYSTESLALLLPNKPTVQRTAAHYELGMSLKAASRLAEAREQIEAGLVIANATAANYLQPLSELALVGLALAEARIEESRSLLRHVRDVSLDREVLSLVAEFFLRVAELALSDGEPERGARLLGAADRVLELTSRLRFRDTGSRAELEQHLRAELGADGFERFRTEGARLTLDATFVEAERTITQQERPDAVDQPADLLAQLSPREREVLDLLVDGLTDREIADRLFISRSTASRHVEAILRKLGVPTRTSAAVVAIRARDRQVPS
ncbi:MAG: LuxR C-terminal-related transcriptional regulator [Thermomicrobiales bacterium]